MGGGGSKSYHHEDIGNTSGIGVMPHKFSTWWDEAVLGHHERTEHRLLREREEQISAQFSDKKVQKEYDIFRGLWAKDGEYTKTYGDENTLTSDQWPESVKAVTQEGLEDAFGQFRVNHNAVLRTYQQFRDEHGVVAQPRAGGTWAPRCAEKGGTCPEWSKSFRHEFEGDLPPDVRQLKGEGLDRFNRYMFQKAQRETMDKAETFIDVIPGVGTIFRATECATERDKDRKKAQCAALGLDAVGDAVGFAAGPVLGGATKVARGTLALAGRGAVTAVEKVAPKALGKAVAAGSKAAAPVARAGADVAAGGAKVAAPVAKVAAPIVKAVKPMTGAAVSAAISADAVKDDLDTGYWDKEGEPEEDLIVPSMELTEPPKSHQPDDSVQYNLDIVHEQPDDRYTIDVTAGSLERQGDQMLGVVVLLMAGGAAYYAYRKLT